VQGSCCEMRAGETSKYLHDKIRAGPVHSHVLEFAASSRVDN
jgi:hypothetical protein